MANCTDKFGNPLNVGDKVWTKSCYIVNISDRGVCVERELGDGTFQQDLIPASEVIADTCFVKPRCITGEKRGECRKCRGMEKFERKKSKSRQATGRANKRKGKESEKKLHLHFQRQGLDSRIIAGSGAYKKSREGADSDLRVKILDKERKVENKKYASKAAALHRIRRLIGETEILYITGFCYVLDENIFYDVIKNSETYRVDAKGNLKSIECAENTYKVREVSDRDFGWLHKFFEQDYADIVSLDESYRDFLFCLQTGFFREIIGF